MVKICHLETTKRCNLRCLHCIYEDVISDEMDTTTTLNAIERLRDMGCELLCLTGGEPLVRNDLLLLIEKANECSIGTALITNGTLLDNDFFNNAGTHLSGITFSIDGPRSVHDMVRGEGCFDRTINAMNLVKKKYKHISVSASITITALNIATVTEIMQELCLAGVSDIHLNDLNIAGNALANRHLLELVWDSNTRHTLFKAMKLVSGTNKIKSAMDCLVTPEVICMSCDGQVYLCSELMTAGHESMGSIFDDKIEVRIKSQHESVGPCHCKYTDYVAGNISATLHNGYYCPHQRGGV